MSKRSPDFTHENATRARRALKEMHDAVAMLYHSKHLEQFELIDNFLLQAQRFAPFEKPDQPPQGETKISHER